MGGNNRSLHEFEKKPSSTHDSALISRVLRSLVICSVFLLVVCYILNSSNLILIRKARDCPSSVSTLSYPNSTSALQPLQTKFQIAEETQDIAAEDEDAREQEQEGEKEEETDLKHIAFGIAASSNLWEQRKQYIRQWWRPGRTRGVVWLDRRVRSRRREGLPEIRISADTSKFPYKHGTGSRSALRISRIVSEMARLKMKDVRWLVMGDDDTVFIVENVVSVLRKYDHNQFYYVGSPSESHVQNLIFSYGMAFGGGGFAISYPLAVELEKMQDRCIKRYAFLYGSDDRIHACMAELGVPLTREPGFHQFDLYGEVLGLLAAHPIAPLVSLHHLDVVEPIFPGMPRPQAVKHLLESAKHDAASLIQQSICYDKQKWWSISVSWGFSVQITRGMLSPRELETPARTFLNWYRRANYIAHSFNTRPVARHPCQRPFTFYISKIYYDRRKKETVSIHKRRNEKSPSCRWKTQSPQTVDTIIVYKKPDPLRWQKSPRRDCCRVLPTGKGSTMHVSVSQCLEGEFSAVE